MAPFIEDVKQVTFNIDYFIAKFEAIPEEQWCVGDYVNRDGRMCAMGHCGVRLDEFVRTAEAIALYSIAPDIMTVNDNLSMDFRYAGSTPKARVINHLRAIKER